MFVAVRGGKEFICWLKRPSSFGLEVPEIFPGSQTLGYALGGH
jgi:hypothetical protein